MSALNGPVPHPDPTKFFEWLRNTLFMRHSVYVSGRGRNAHPTKKGPGRRPMSRSKK
jgi:hypothetical protein